MSHNPACTECRHRANAGPNYDPQRRTGRTSGQLVMALCGMLMGKRVLFVSHTHAAGSAHKRWCMEWLMANGWLTQTNVPIQHTAESISFGSGELEFRSVSLSPLRECPGRARKIDLTIEDHHAAEVRKAHERKAQFTADQQTIFALMRKQGMYSVSLGREKRHGT